MEARDRIRQFVKEEILFDDSATVNDDTLLLEGVMDSLAIMQMIQFLEEEFDVTIDDADMTKDHFRTVVDIEQMLTEKATQG